MMRSELRYALVALLMLPLPIAWGAALSAAESTQADERPKWEAGVAAAALTVAEYPASDEYHTLAVPLPYFVYHGPVLQSDNQGSRVRKRLAAHVEVDISGGGALASNDNGSDARQGMPELDYLLELGPNLRIGFDGPSPDSEWVINLPARGVASIGDDGVHWRGLLLAPELAYRADRYLDGKLSIWLSLGTEFSTSHLQRYFYEVAPQYATAERPTYSADAGYLGSSLGLRGAYRISRKLRVFGSVRYYNYQRAANEDSPLYRSSDGVTAAIGVSWSLWQSGERVAE